MWKHSLKGHQSTFMWYSLVNTMLFTIYIAINIILLEFETMISNLPIRLKLKPIQPPLKNCTSIRPLTLPIHTFWGRWKYNKDMIDDPFPVPGPTPSQVRTRLPRVELQVTVAPPPSPQ